jgi:RNA polymerase sigma-B factor
MPGEQLPRAAAGEQPGRSRADLESLNDSELLAAVHAEPRDSMRRTAACELLVSRYDGLVRYCVRRYRGSPELTEDLMQIGYVGLLSAINNFDPAFGRPLTAYAVPCISGELKRHFRDKRWQLRVERPLQELVLELRRAAPRLTQRLGRDPKDDELAAQLGRSQDEIRQARQAALILTGTTSLDAPLPGGIDGQCLADLLGQEDPGFEHAVELQSVLTHWEELPGREQRVLLLRFYSDMTQRQIGQQLGISQMHVCRLLSHALGYLRERVLDLEPA